MDIEGSEWLILEEQLELVQPQQIFFELHTAESNPEFVPRELVKGKDRMAVNQLLLKLYDKGYRVIDKNLNIGDTSCAEISMVLI